MISVINDKNLSKRGGQCFCTHLTNYSWLKRRGRGNLMGRKVEKQTDKWVGRESNGPGSPGEQAA